MIRRPTSLFNAHDWHRKAIAGLNPARHEGDPQPGYYKRRMVKGGPWVPVRIWIEQDIDPETGELTRDEVFRIEVEGLDGGDPAYHWTYLTAITSEEYERLIDAPLRDPRMWDSRKPIDLSETPTLPEGVYL